MPRKKVEKDSFSYSLGSIEKAYKAEYTLQDRCNRDGGGANCTQAVSHNCPNALKLGFNMLDVLKWYKGGCGLINESYTNLYVAEGTGNITATTGSRAYG
ncbi:TPA: hypothetical protein ACH3X1_012198 [Trebouxia sp. C0004]